MPYRYSRERLDYSDFASGRVFRSVPGRTAFPVRLADELFQRCLALRPLDQPAGPVALYDPVCGGASLLCTLAFLHWPSIGQIVASDADPEALALAARNLALLTPEGIAERRMEIATLHAEYGKDSHAEALASVDHLAAQLDALVRTHPLPTRHFLADALDPASLSSHLEPRSIDVVIADVPHGQRTHWLDPQTDQAAPDGSPVLWRLLDALWPTLAPNAVLAIVGDKSQRARHERYAPAGTLQIGKRRATFLTVRSSSTIDLAPLTPDERHAFAEAQIADFAEWLVDQGQAPDLEAAHGRARAEIEAELAGAVASGDLFWSALDASGETVGWLWVKSSSPGLPPRAAYLYQILVKPVARRRGHGLAMLATLEELLTEPGRDRASPSHPEHQPARSPSLRPRHGFELVERIARHSATSASGCVRGRSCTAAAEPESRCAVSEISFGVPYSAPDRRRPGRRTADVEVLLVMDLTSRPPLAGILVRFAAVLVDGVVPMAISIPAASCSGSSAWACPASPATRCRCSPSSSSCSPTSGSCRTRRWC